MDIKVDYKDFRLLHVTEEEKKSTHTWAAVDVTVNGLIIPNIRLINKPSENETVSFFAYPRIKSGDKYQDVLVLSKEQKKEIEEAVGAIVKEYLVNENPEIDIRRISLCKDKGRLVAVGDVTINGIGVQGVRLFETEDHNRYVQLPQYQTKSGEWKNLVKLDNVFAMSELNRQMSIKYEQLEQAKALEKGTQPKEQQATEVKRQAAERAERKNKKIR